MIYDWQCKKCEAEACIITNKFEHSDVNPDDIDEGDIVSFNMTKGKKKCPEHEWVKQLGGFKLARGANWTGRKGHW